MSILSRLFIAAIVTSSLMPSIVFANDIQALPVLPEESIDAPQDWLVDQIDAKATVYRNGKSNELILDNGLIRRTFRITPNAATVGFKNLMTGESIIRGVKPEASLMLDGIEYPVGGLLGQPNYAFLRAEWIEALTNNPDAMQFVGFKIGEPKERMKWKRVRHHAPDAQWPPKGVYLRMDYEMPASSVSKNTAMMDSGNGRDALIKEEFNKLSDNWTRVESKAHARSSFINEAKVGEIYTPAHTAVYAERALPVGTQLVEAVINTGTDKSSSWGPGIAVVFCERVIKFNIRTGGHADETSATFGVWDGARSNIQAGGHKGLDLTVAWTLRMRFEEGALYCEAKPARGDWISVERIPLPDTISEPKFVRVGKMDETGGDSDYEQPGELVRLLVEDFSAYSALNAEALAKRQSKLQTKQQIRVSVHYNLYDGAPILSKWITVENGTDKTITVDKFISEILGAVEPGSYVERSADAMPTPNLHVETDYAFAGMTTLSTAYHSVHWVPDPEYHTQVNYLKLTPCLLEVRPEMGPAATVEPGETFESFRAFILVPDSEERERNSLAKRRFYRILAPWATENPLMMHVRKADEKAVKFGIDQCAEVGFEMIILTFGSGFNIEDDSKKYLEKMKEYADYARSKGIEIGGYSLLSSRDINKETNVVMPKGQRARFGNAPCLESEWGQNYFDTLYNFYKTTNWNLLEHDGSYPGDPCMSTEHPGHKGWDDSQWTQYQRIANFYKWSRENGLFLNVPDFYYLAGSNKCGMGYREVNWSLPRAQQVIHARQNIYDGIWEKTPSMGWMFVPLTVYHGGGAAATIEPLEENLDHYERMMLSNLGMGVQACYRGPRLYDTDRTKAMVKGTVDWFKKYRDILESDMVHGRRADGQDLDWMLHVNPKLKRKGMLVVFNPLKTSVEKTIRVNLYYTGLSETARISEKDNVTNTYPIDRLFNVDIPAKIPAEGMSWYVIE